MLQMAGNIRDLVVHPRFDLYVPKFEGGIPGDIRLDRGPQTSGWVQRVGHFTADFAYLYTGGGGIVVEDVKSKPTRTEAYRLRKKLVESTYGITITEIE